MGGGSVLGRWTPVDTAGVASSASTLQMAAAVQHVVFSLSFLVGHSAFFIRKPVKNQPRFDTLTVRPKQTAVSGCHAGVVGLRRL